MKAIFHIVLTAMFLWNPYATGQQEELALHPITESLYVIRGAGCNVVFWVTKEGILVVDSGEKPSMATKVLLKIRDISDRSIRYLAFTHYHHNAGAEDFPASAVTLSHKNTRENIPLRKKVLLDLFDKNIKELELKMAELKEQEDTVSQQKIQDQLELRKRQLESIEKEKVLLPQITFEAKSTIYMDGQQAELLYLGPGHTNGDLLVYFSHEKVLYMGDLLYTNGWAPRLDGDAGSSVDNWLKILKHVATMDVKEIIPGHGEPTDMEGFITISKVFCDYLTDLKIAVKKFIENGASLEEIKAELTLPKYQQLGMADVLLPWNIEGVHREIIGDMKAYQ